MRKIFIWLLIASYTNLILSPATFALGKTLSPEDHFDQEVLHKNSLPKENVKNGPHTFHDRKGKAPLHSEPKPPNYLIGNTVHLNAAHFKMENKNGVIFPDEKGDELARLFRDSEGTYHLQSTQPLDFQIDDEVSLDSIVVNVKGDFIVDAVTKIGFFVCQSASKIVNTAKFKCEEVILCGADFLNWGKFRAKEFMTTNGSGFLENAPGAIFRVLENLTATFSEFKAYGDMDLQGVSRVKADYASIEGFIKCNQAQFAFDTDTCIQPSARFDVGYGLALSSRGQLTFLGKLYEDQKLRNEALLDFSLIGIQLIAGTNLYQYGMIDLESLSLKLFAQDNYGERFGFTRSGVFDESAIVVNASTAHLNGETIAHSDYVVNAIQAELEGRRDVGARFVVSAQDSIVQTKEDESSAKLTLLRADEITADGTFKEGAVFAEANKVTLGGDLDKVEKLVAKARDAIILNPTFEGDVQGEAVFLAGDGEHKGTQDHKHGAKLKAGSVVVQATDKLTSGAEYRVLESMGVKADSAELDENFDAKAGSLQIRLTGKRNQSKISGKIDVSDLLSIDSNGHVKLENLQSSAAQTRFVADWSLRLLNVTHNGKNLQMTAPYLSVWESSLDLSGTLQASALVYLMMFSKVASKTSRTRAVLNLEFLNYFQPGGVTLEDFWRTPTGPNAKWYSEWWKQPIVRALPKIGLTLGLMYAAGPLKVALLLPGLIAGLKGAWHGSQMMYGHMKDLYRHLRIEKIPDYWRFSHMLEVGLDTLDLTVSVVQVGRTIKSFLPDSSAGKKTDTPEGETEKKDDATNPPKPDQPQNSGAESEGESTQAEKKPAGYLKYANDFYQQYVSPNFAQTPDSIWWNILTASMAHFGDSHTTVALFDLSLGNLFVGGNFNRNTLYFANANKYVANSRTFLNIGGFVDYDSFLAYQSSVTSFGHGYVGGARYGIFGNTVSTSQSLTVSEYSAFGGMHIGLTAGENYDLILPDHLKVYGRSLTLCGQNLDDIPDLMKQTGKYDGFDISDMVSVRTKKDVVFEESTKSKSKNFHLHANSIKLANGRYATELFVEEQPAALKEGSTIKVDGERYTVSIVDGKYIFKDSTGNPVDLPDGSYNLKKDLTLTVTNGNYELTYTIKNGTKIKVDGIKYTVNIVDGKYIFKDSAGNSIDLPDGEYKFGKNCILKVNNGKYEVVHTKQVSKEVGRNEVTADGTLGIKSDTDIDLGAYTVIGGYGFTSLEAAGKINTYHIDDDSWRWGAATIIGGNGMTYQYQDPVTGEITTRNMGIYIDAKEFNGNGCSFLSPGDCLIIVPNGFTNRGFSKQWITEQSSSGGRVTKEVKKVSFLEGTYNVGKLIIRAANGKIILGAGNFFLKDGGELYAPKGVTFQQLENEEVSKSYGRIWDETSREGIVKPAVIANGTISQESEDATQDGPPAPPQSHPDVESPLYVIAPEGNVLLKGVVYMGNKDHLFLKGKKVILDRSKMTNRSLAVSLAAWQNASFFEVWKSLDALQGADDLLNQMKGDLDGNPLLTALSPNVSGGTGMEARYSMQEVLGPGSAKTDKITIEASAAFIQRGGYSFEAKKGYITTPLWVQQGAKLKGQSQFYQAGGEAAFDAGGPDAGGVARGGYTKTTTWIPAEAKIDEGYYNVGCLRQDCGTLKTGVAHGSIDRIDLRERYNTQTNYSGWCRVSPTGKVSGGINLGTSSQWVQSGIFIDDGGNLTIGDGNARGASYCIGNANPENGHVHKDTRIPDYTLSFSASGSMQTGQANPSTGQPAPNLYSGSVEGSGSVNGWGGGLTWNTNNFDAPDRPHRLFDVSGRASLITPWFTLDAPLVTGVHGEEWHHFGQNVLEAVNYGPFYPLYCHNEPQYRAAQPMTTPRMAEQESEQGAPTQASVGVISEDYEFTDASSVTSENAVGTTLPQNTAPMMEGDVDPTDSSSVSVDPVDSEEPRLDFSEFMKTPYGYVNQAGFTIPGPWTSSLPTLMEVLEYVAEEGEAPRHFSGLYMATETPTASSSIMEAWGLQKKYGSNVEFVHYGPSVEPLSVPLRFNLDGCTYEFSYRLPNKPFYLQSASQLEAILKADRILSSHPSLYIQRSYKALNNPHMAVGIANSELSEILGKYSQWLYKGEAKWPQGPLGSQILRNPNHIITSTTGMTLEELCSALSHEGMHGYLFDITGSTIPFQKFPEKQFNLLRNHILDGIEGGLGKNPKIRDTYYGPLYYIQNELYPELGERINYKFMKSLEESILENVPIWEVNPEFKKTGLNRKSLFRAYQEGIAEMPTFYTEFEFYNPNRVQNIFSRSHHGLELNLIENARARQGAYTFVPETPTPVTFKESGKGVVPVKSAEVAEAFENLKWYHNPKFQTSLKLAHTAMPFLDYGFHVLAEYQNCGDGVEAMIRAGITTPIDAASYGMALGGVGYAFGGPVVWVAGVGMVAAPFIPDYDPASNTYVGPAWMAYEAGGRAMQGVKWTLHAPAIPAEATIKAVDDHYPGFFANLATSIQKGCMIEFAQDIYEEESMWEYFDAKHEHIRQRTEGRGYYSHIPLYLAEMFSVDVPHEWFQARHAEIDRKNEEVSELRWRDQKAEDWQRMMEQLRNLGN